MTYPLVWSSPVEGVKIDVYDCAGPSASPAKRFGVWRDDSQGPYVLWADTIEEAMGIVQEALVEEAVNAGEEIDELQQRCKAIQDLVTQIRKDQP